MTHSEEDPCQRWIKLSDDHLESSTIDDTLGAITDDLWVVAAIADRINVDSAVLADLLAVALKRSEGTVERLRASFVLQDAPNISDFCQSSSSVDDDLVSYFRENSSDARMCLLRSLLLNRNDRLNTFREMFAASVDAPAESDNPEWDDPWLDTADNESERQSDPGAPPLPLSAFLTQTLVDSAHLLAARGLVGPLQVLFKRHGPVLWPSRLSILACIPDHVLPSLYQDILPRLDTSRDVEHQSPAEAWRKDWTEHPRVQAALLTSGYAIPQTQVLIDQAPQPMSSQELSVWYQQRAHSILTSTGMVDTALLIVQHATSQGIPGLDELGEELSLLSRLVYDAQAAARDGPEEDWTLEQWKSMDSLAVVRALLALSTPESLIANIRKFVLPYLFVLESRAERAGNTTMGISLKLLSDFVLAAPLEMVARIFEASKPTLPAGQRLISDDENMARLALACLYGSDSLGEWHVMSQIFECLPAWNNEASGNEDEDAVETTIVSLGSFVTPTTARPKCSPSDLFLFFRPLPLPSLSRALDILDVHLESGEILSRWDVPAPLRWFLQSTNDKNSQRARAVRMARQPGASHTLRSQEDWEWLLEDMLKLSRTNDNGLRSAFGLLSQADILSIFLSGLLSTGRKCSLTLLLIYCLTHAHYRVADCRGSTEVEKVHIVIR